MGHAGPSLVEPQSPNENRGQMVGPIVDGVVETEGN